MSENDNEPFSSDWQAIRSQFNIDESAREQSVLKQRAKQYAEPLTDSAELDTDAEWRKFAIFTLGTEHYGIEVPYVRAIRPLTTLIWLPGVPAFYRGVVNVKGRIVSVLDLRYFFELDSKDVPVQEYIVTEIGAFTIALLASRVHGIESIAMNRVQSLENLRYAYGVNADQITLLNLPALFEDERLLVNTRED